MSNLSDRSPSDRKNTVNVISQTFTLQQILSFPFLVCIRAYRFVSPVKQIIFGPYARCRFHPTCSEFALECFQTLPLHKAMTRSLLRICRCNPMHPGGHDPVHPPSDLTSSHSE
ncbi:MAG: membrane protein insertion efficiency factor YidD [Verrucomicrobia bacterium]|nr:membrane protein insertion efficiency factor YidD [Verrucomicrobiota bacterium]MDA0905339.1 membrane protein insertion efficiency factor YidD [Verrucomicrobiota bacterium]MDA1078297.1 membrane protein insertion efficiency factor YidD [Verrucomicrobiota bacterium]